MKIDLDTYIISDTHFGHKNIIKYCDRPENHDEIMFRNWFRTVSIDDTVLHLGDLTFKSETYLDLGILPGNKYLIKGNHDHKKDSWYESKGFKVIESLPFCVVNRQLILLSHYPIEIDMYDDNGDDWNINIHGHVHNHEPKMRKIGNRTYINVSIEMMNYTPVKLGEILNG